MHDKSFRFDSDVDGLSIQAYIWGTANPNAVVIISHGAAEHALRYERFARALNAAGIETWATDHRGHGQSPGSEGFGDFGEGGWNGLVDDMGQFIAMARKAHPNLPIVLFAHSMGSAAAQQYILDRSHTIDALILSGSSARMAPREGEQRTSRTDMNRTFEGRTNYDWLSRDQAEVDKYIADPLCGFDSVGGARIRANMASRRSGGGRELLKNIRSDLPCLLVAGDKDPVNNNLEGLYLLERLWREAGVQRIDHQYYEGGRHEMLNEINRDEVTQNIIHWIKDALHLT
jgi:alpha-beta hydrolase superfamily lysophospholipase